MSFLEKSELLLIVIVSICTWLLSAMLPNQLTIGHLALTVSALFLLQSLLRDLCLIAKIKRGTQQSMQYRKVRCLCLESAVGITGIIIGAGIISTGVNQVVTINADIWTLLIIAVMLTSFLIKDFVIHSKPWRITHDKDHLNILVN